MAKTERQCPLCNQPLSPIEQAAHPPVPVVNSVGEAVGEAIRDVEAWAEGDAFADDGEVLWLSDLAGYLSRLLAPPLMRMYRERLARHQERIRPTRSAIRKEVASTATAAIARVEPRAMGRPPSDVCRNGHRRTPENVRRSGACLMCERENSRARRAAEKARVEKTTCEAE